MLINKYYQKMCYRLRERLQYIIVSSGRKIYWKAQGLHVGKGTSLPKLTFSWPHQVRIGRSCVLEDGIHFKFDGVWQSGPRICIGNDCFVGAYTEFNIRQEIIVGDYCLIASGCKFIDHDHGFSRRSIPIKTQVDGVETPIVLEDDVWLGVNVVVLKGVKIGRGAIVSAGSVVTKSIPPYEIWAGIPARKISERP